MANGKLEDAYNIAWAQEWNRLDPEMKQVTLSTADRQLCHAAGLRAVAALSPEPRPVYCPQCGSSGECFTHCPSRKSHDDGQEADRG